MTAAMWVLPKVGTTWHAVREDGSALCGRKVKIVRATALDNGPPRVHECCENCLAAWTPKTVQAPR